MSNGDGEKNAKVVTKPVKKPTALELERLAARQRMHEANVRAYLAGR